MEHLIICLAASLMIGSGISINAQTTAQQTPAAPAAKTAASPLQGLQEIRFAVGVRGPVDRSIRNGSPEIVSLSYARYNQKGLGFRAGAEFMPSIMGIDSYFGIPVAFSARTRARSFSQSVRTGLESAAVGAVRDAVYGYEPSARSIAGDFLFGLFNRAEFFAGLTPGYVFGTNTPYGKSYEGMTTTERTMELRRRAVLSADAGFSMSFRIWRFNLSFVPAVHYLLTNNFVSVTSTSPVSSTSSTSSASSASTTSGSDGTAKVTETPVRFQYSVLGALSFSF